MSRVQLDGVCAGYGQQPVLHGLSARIEAGELVVLIGANASGKTTLVRVLAGLHAPTAGRITWPDSATARRPVGLAVTPDALPSGLSGFHAIDLIRAALKTDTTVAALDYAQVVELYPLLGQSIGSYSLGTRQKLAITLALVGDSPLLLLDESLNGLDLASIGHTLDWLCARIQTTRQSVLLATHTIDLAQGCAQRVWLLEHGRLVREWNAADLARMQREGKLISREVMQRLRKT